MIPVLGSQPACDVSHKAGGRMPLLSTRHAVTPKPLRGLLPISLLGQTDGRTNTRPFRKPCFTYYAGSVKNNGERSVGSKILETDERPRPAYKVHTLDYDLETSVLPPHAETDIDMLQITILTVRHSLTKS